ncbi:hypothetical protein O9X98_05060 [Agrobacterium salinitolerans]|nr:hypothetical protein [Agrobacterium salinitolerans]
MSNNSPSREKAFEKAMHTFWEIDKRLGSDNPKYPTLDVMMGGYRGFAERVAGDAFLRIDSTISPLIERAAEGTDVAITGALLSNIRHVPESNGTIRHVATVLDSEGTPRFRLEFNPRPGHGDDDSVVSDINIRECPADDLDYESSNRIASAHVGRPFDGKGSDGGHGYVEYSHFAKFVAAMDILKPFVAANLDKVDRGEPWNGLELTFSEINMVNYIPAFAEDGGLPGQLFLEVSDTMAHSGAKRAFRFMANRLGDTIKELTEQGAVFGARFASFNDDDYEACAIPGLDGTASAVLVTQPGLIFDHDTFIAWSDLDTDGKPTKTTLVALERGTMTLDAVEAYMTGNKIEAPTANYYHADASVDLPRDFMETSVLSTAPFTVAYALETLKDRRASLENFDKFLDTHHIEVKPVGYNSNAHLL